MPGIEVQWIGSSCGRHGPYTFYRGFRLIQEGKISNYTLGEFYFVKNSSTQPICIAELQLVWYDASTDTKLASARLYFRPEDTPAGRLNYHGEDELLYADQKVVIKCHDMATWVCPGSEWTTGLSLPCEAQFVQLNGSPKLSYMGPACENKLKENTQSEKASGVTRVHIMTFPAYCRYMALKKRMSEGACFTMKQILSLGGMVASNRTTKMVFCRESFHYPSLDKFELSIENKAPVLKGRPRKKKRLKIENSANKVVRNRFLTEINGNQLDIDSPKSKVSDDDLGTDSDVSEESCQSTETCRPKKVNAVIEKNFVASVNIQLPVSKSQASGPPPLQPSIKAHVPRLIPMTPVRLNSTAEPAVKAIMNLESKPPPLVKSDFQPKLTTAVTTVTISAVKSNHMQQQSSLSSMSTSSSSVISMSKQTMSYTTTVTMATKVPVSASNATSLQKISKEPIVGQPVQGLDTVQSKESRQPRLIKAREDNRVIKVEEQGKENVEMEKKTRKRLREPGDFSDIENCENEDEKFFMKSLRDFMKSRNTPLGKIPALGFKKVNLWTMYNATQKLGGYEMVTSKRQWRDVYDSLGGSTTITSAATYTRRHYEKLLLPYERYVRGQLSATSNDCEHETKLTKDRPTMQKHKDITQPSSKTTFSNQKVPIKIEMSEVAVQREPVKTMSRQPDQAKPVKSSYHQDISHNPKLVSCSQSLQQHQPKLQSQGILLRVPKPQENTTVVPEIKKIKVERLEHCVGTAPSVSVGNAVSKRNVIDLTEAEESGNRKDQPRVPHRPSSHANLTKVPTTVTNLVRDHPQAERPKSRGIVSQVHQPSMRTQRKNGKLSAGELKAVADEHFKTQVTARQLFDGVQQHKETRSVNVSQIERYQSNQVVRTKEKLRNPDQKFELQESEAVHCESVPGLKRRVSRMSPSEHVKKRRFVKQPLQVSVDDHFEQWRRRTQEVQTKPQSVASPRGHPSSKGKPSTQVVPTSRSVVSSHSTGEVTVGQERAITPQYSRSSYGSEIRASVTTDSHARSSPIMVADSLKKQSQYRAREKQHVNTNSTKPVKESHKTSCHGQDNRLQVKESQYIKSEGGNHLHEQRHVPQDSHCHVSHSNTQVTFQASSNRAQRMLVKAKDELPTPEFYPVMVNTEDLSSRPPSLEMEMGDVFPSASSYVGTHFYPAPWAPTGEFLEYPAQGGYQLVAAATAADKMGQCSSSRIFMPPSIFPPMGTMPPLSPSLLAPGHLVASPDSTELRIHPHCMLGSFPVPCTHQMASATTNFPLLQG